MPDILESNLAALWGGVRQGWWEGVDEDARLPVRVLNIADFHETALLAHAWVRLGKFASVKEAKRAGWGEPIRTGRFRIGTWVMDIRQPH